MGSQLYYLFCSSSSSSSLEDSTFEWAFCCQSKFNGSIVKIVSQIGDFQPWTLDWTTPMKGTICKPSTVQEAWNNMNSHSGDSSDCRIVCQFDQKNGWSVFLLSIDMHVTIITQMRSRSYCGHAKVWRAFSHLWTTTSTRIAQGPKSEKPYHLLNVVSVVWEAEIKSLGCNTKSPINLV